LGALGLDWEVAGYGPGTSDMVLRNVNPVSSILSVPWAMPVNVSAG